MDKFVTISKSVDLGTLTAECKVQSNKVTGLSLNADTNLNIYGADDLTETQILALVDAHVKSIKVDLKQKFKDDVDASPLTPDTKTLLKRLVDLR